MAGRPPGGVRSVFLYMWPVWPLWIGRKNMDLDVVFDIEQAEEAGLEIGKDSEGYSIIVPNRLVDGMRVRIDAYVWKTETGTNMAMVRANKWGSNYTPLTEWFKAHNIQWREW